MLQFILNSIYAHPTSWSLGAAYFATAFIGALPEPGTKEPIGLMSYRFFYNFLHTLGNTIPNRFRPPVAPPAGGV